MRGRFYRQLDALYRRILVRPIDSLGYETYSALLESGDKSLEEIAEILRSSEEFVVRQQARERALRFRTESDERARRGADPARAPIGLSVRIILLEGNPERATHVRDHLNPGLASQGAADSEVISAIDGTTPDGMAEIRARIGLEEKPELGSPSSFMKGKLGCALSHASAWASIPDGAPALVLEDDAVVAPDLMEKAVAILEFLDREHPGWHLLHLYSPRLWADPRGDPAMPYREEFDGHHGNVGYLISPEGRSTLMPLVTERLTRLEAADLARAQDEPHFALDHSILHWARAGVVRAFWATEHLVETIGQIGPERESEDLHSSIFHEPRER